MKTKIQIQLYFLLLFSIEIFAQQIHFVDFKTANGHLNIYPETKEVKGKVMYQFEVKKETDTISIDAVNMNFLNVLLNEKKAFYINTGKQIQFVSKFKKGKYQLSFNFEAQPKQTMYFIGEGETKQVWTQGQGKNTSHWFPSFDDANEKVIFDISVAFDKNYTVLANGILNPFKTKITGENKLWFYEMQKPMSSYLLAISIGKFKQQIQKSSTGIPLEMYLPVEDANKFGATYKHTKKMFDFLEKEIGVKYPWGIYRQVPAKDFLYGGMENTTLTIFNQDYVVDEIGFNDKNYINVNAHELAHQWFGDMVTAKSGKHHWLQEGFATYYALLAEKEIFGEDHFNWKMYEIAERLQQVSKTDTIPILNEKASSLTFYQKGAWALHILRENIGEENFRKAVQSYLNKYAFQNVETSDFLNEINKVSKFDTQTYSKKWLESGEFQVKEAIAVLSKNKLIQQYFEIAEMKPIPFNEKQTKFMQLLQSDAQEPIIEEIISQVTEYPFEEIFDFMKEAIQIKNLKLRQEIAKSIKNIPPDFRTEYQTLLEDDSYITKEIAMNMLFSSFPEDRFQLLDNTRKWIGFNDKNLRVTWLTMALITPDYKVEDKPRFYDELLDYSSSKYESGLRQNALNNLLYLDPDDANVMFNLVNALVSHRWQFSKFARENVRNLLKSEKHRTHFAKMLEELPENEKFQLNRLLQE